jgi:hypothetical protein
VASLLKLLKTERTLKGRFLLLNVLSNSATAAKSVFVAGGALVALEAWLTECKATHPRLLQLVLTALAELPVTLRALQVEGCGIGKVVSGLKKHVSEDVRKAAATVIGQWKQLVDTTVHATAVAPPPSVPSETTTVGPATQVSPKVYVDLNTSSPTTLVPLPDAVMSKPAKPINPSSQPKPSAATPSLMALDDDNMFSRNVASARSKLSTPRLIVGDGLRKPARHIDTVEVLPFSPTAATSSLPVSPKEPKDTGSPLWTARPEALPVKREVSLETEQVSVTSAATALAAKQVATGSVVGSERATMPTPPTVAQAEVCVSTAEAPVMRSPTSNTRRAHTQPQAIMEEVMADNLDDEDVDPFATHPLEMPPPEIEPVPPPFIKVSSSVSLLTGDPPQPCRNTSLAAGFVVANVS